MGSVSQDESALGDAHAVLKRVTEPCGCGGAQSYVRLNRWPFYLSWFLSFAMIIAMSCSERLRKQYPLNYCFLVRARGPLCRPWEMLKGVLHPTLAWGSSSH